MKPSNLDQSVDSTVQERREKYRALIFYFQLGANGSCFICSSTKGLRSKIMMIRTQASDFYYLLI